MCSVIGHISFDSIGDGVIRNILGSLNHLASSRVLFLSWGCFNLHWPQVCGTLRSPLDSGSTTAWVGGTQSNLHKLFRRCVISSLNNSGTIGPAWYRKLENGGSAMTEQAGLCYFGSKTLVDCKGSSQHPWPRSMTCCWQYKQSCCMLNDMMATPGSSVASSLIFNLYYYLGLSMTLETLVICNAVHDGRGLEVKHLMENKDWLF